MWEGRLVFVIYVFYLWLCSFFPTNGRRKEIRAEFETVSKSCFGSFMSFSSFFESVFHFRYWGSSLLILSRLSSVGESGFERSRKRDKGFETASKSRIGSSLYRIILLSSFIGF